MVGYKKKTNLKNCGILWVGEIPEHWDMKKFKHFYASSMGNTILKEDLSDEAATPVYSATEYVEILGYIDNPNVILNKDDFIIPARGNSIGHVKLVAEKCTCTQTTIYARSLNPGRINPNFVYWYQIGLRSKLYEFDNTAIPQLTVRQVKENPILVPSPDEQQAIAAFLDRETVRIDALIQKKERMIELLKEKRIALITQAVTKGLDANVPMRDSGIEWLGEVPEHWRITSIKHIAKVVNGSTPSSSEPDFWDGDILWATPDDLGSLNDKYLCSTNRQITKEGYQSCGTTIAPGNSIVLSTRAPIGHVALTLNDMCCNQGCRILVPQGSIVSDYLYYLLLSSKAVLDALGQGSTFKELNRERLSSFKLPLPRIEEQKDIITYIDLEILRNTQISEKLKESISLLREYRASLIHHAVTGKIDLRGHDAQAQ